MYTFYTNVLRFVASRADRSDPLIDAMMDKLVAAADEIEASGGSFTVAVEALPQTARAFAGVAGFLQQQILPEAVASGHDEVATQLRWAVDASMEMMTTLMTRAAEQPSGPVTVRLAGEPPPLN